MLFLSFASGALPETAGVVLCVASSTVAVQCRCVYICLRLFPEFRLSIAQIGSIAVDVPEYRSVCFSCGSLAVLSLSISVCPSVKYHPVCYMDSLSFTLFTFASFPQ